MINDLQGIKTHKSHQSISKLEIPGFVDLQVNGFLGVGFEDKDLTEERLIFACKELVRHGTIAFLPTIITSPPEVLEQNLKLIAKVMKRDDLKDHVLGAHVEGPFISKVDGARGAHNIDWVRKPDIALLDAMYEWSEGNVKLLTIAAELEGAEALCQHAVELGITVSLGHQMATNAEIIKLTKAGARSLTHLGNGLPKLISRHENPIWAGITNDDLTAMIITDGHHLPLPVLKTIVRAKDLSQLVVVSDASPIAGLPPGRYVTLGNEAILDASGGLYNPDTGYFVGSSYIMIDCMNYLASIQLLSLEQMIQLGFYNPLQLLNIDPASIKSDFSIGYDTFKKRFAITS